MLLGRKCVYVAAHGVDELGYLPGAALFRALEEQVLQEVGRPGDLPGLVHEPVPTQKPRLTERTSGMCSVTMVRPPSTTVVSRHPEPGRGERSPPARLVAAAGVAPWPGTPLLTGRDEPLGPGRGIGAGGRPEVAEGGPSFLLPAVFERHRAYAGAGSPPSPAAGAGPSATGLAVLESPAKATPCRRGRCRPHAPRGRPPRTRRLPPVPPSCPGTAWTAWRCAAGRRGPGGC